MKKLDIALVLDKINGSTEFIEDINFEVIPKVGEIIKFFGESPHCVENKYVYQVKKITHTLNYLEGEIHDWTSIVIYADEKKITK